MVFDQQQGTSNNQFVQPQVQFVSPPAVLQSSKSPSDSIEKFRNMKKFTIENGFMVNLLGSLKETICTIDPNRQRLQFFKKIHA